MNEKRHRRKAGASADKEVREVRIMKVKGVNLGNWLVLEKWMSPALFAGTTAEDEYYLPRQLSKEVYEARIKIHRSEYITERDFVTIKSMGMEAVRIPVPYFIFGDREPFIGCIEELDKAFNWAEAYGLQILIDLHTAPLGQNGFDNGGICGVCKWSKHPEEVEFVLSVLERLAERYGERKGLWGIEVINEPVTENMWETMKVPERYPAVDPELAEGSGPVTLDFLRGFYKDAYDRIRKYMPEEKYVVIHDGFELKAWKGYMQEEKYKNVVLDTHQYLMVAEANGCEQTMEGYLKYIREHFQKDIQEMEEYFPVICGEWCLFNSLACGWDTKGGQSVLNGLDGEVESSVSDEEKKEYEIRMPDVEEYDKEMILAFEKDVLGIYLSGHPLERYRNIMEKMISAKTTDFQPDEESGVPKVYDGQKVIIGGMITEKTIKYTRNNKVMAFLTVEDLLGTVEIVVFPRDYEKWQAMLNEDARVFVQGRVNAEDDKPSKLICEKIQNFKEIHKEIWIQFQNMEAYQSMERELYNILRESDGKDRVVIYVREPKAVKRLSENWTVNGDEELIQKLAEKFGMENVKTI